MGMEQSEDPATSVKLMMAD